MTTPASAETLKWLHPMRTSRYMFSEAYNPWMRGVRMMADSLRDTRQPLPADHPGIVAERKGACLFSKRLERGRFVWPAAKDGKVSMSASQLSMPLEGINWRMPQKTWKPLMTG